MTFDEFTASIQSSLGLEQNSDWLPESRLQSDLGMDSLAMLELLVLLDEAGHEIPEDMVTSYSTLGDVYRVLEGGAS